MENLKVEKYNINTRVENALNCIRPHLVTDGGNVRVLEITEKRDLILEFVGNCRHCPMSETTFKAGVEQTIRNAVPEINRVIIT